MAEDDQRRLAVGHPAGFVVGATQQLRPRAWFRFGDGNRPPMRTGGAFVAAVAVAISAPAGHDNTSLMAPATWACVHCVVGDFDVTRVEQERSGVEVVLPKELIVSLLGSGIKNGVLGEIYLIRDFTVLSPITLAPLGNRTRSAPGC